jgi:hypothetical protein
MKVDLYRRSTSDQGTVGRLEAGEFRCLTLELPWHDNANGLSCIPVGSYRCLYGYSYSRRKHSYRLENPLGVSQVPHRSGVLIHEGNFAGDKRKGWIAHVLGCILLGNKLATMPNKNKVRQLAILASLVTLKKFEQHMGRKPFTLTIHGIPEDINVVG